MDLFKFSQDFGVPIRDLTADDIIWVIESGGITKQQGEKLLQELKQADSFWHSAVSGIKCSSCLWQD